MRDHVVSTIAPNIQPYGYLKKIQQQLGLGFTELDLLRETSDYDDGCEYLPIH